MKNKKEVKLTLSFGDEVMTKIMKFSWDNELMLTLSDNHDIDGEKEILKEIIQLLCSELNKPEFLEQMRKELLK